MLQAVYDTPWQLSAMLYRGDFLRAQATMPNSVDLAVFLVFGLAVYFMAVKPSKLSWPWLGCCLFAAAFLLARFVVCVTYCEGK